MTKKDSKGRFFCHALWNLVYNQNPVLLSEEGNQHTCSYS